METNEEGQAVAITISEGNKDKITIPLKKYVIKYNKKGVPCEKQILVRNSYTSSWKLNSVYKYDYNTNNELLAMQYNKGNETEYWNIEYEMFSASVKQYLLAENTIK